MCEKFGIIGARNDIWGCDCRELRRCLKAVQKKRCLDLSRYTKRAGRKVPKRAELLRTQVASDEIMPMQSKDIEKRRLIAKLSKLQIALFAGAVPSRKSPRLRATNRLNRIDVCRQGSSRYPKQKGLLVRFARTCGVRLHTRIVQNDEITATTS